MTPEEISECTDIELLKSLVAEAKLKASGLDIKQNGLKTANNSLFGAAGNGGFVFFDNDLAESITLSGQLTIKAAENSINVFMNKTFKTEGHDYVGYIDTDSAHVDMSKFIDTYLPDGTRDEKADFLDQVVKTKLNKVLLDSAEEIRWKMNAPEQKMFLKREKIVQSGILIAKKRYVYDVIDSEGVRYEENKVKVTGVEIVKSTTPGVCKKELKAMLRVIFDEGEEAMQNRVKSFREEFMKMPLSDIGMPRRASEIDKYVDSNGNIKTGATAQAKAAITFNAMLNKLKLNDTYAKIKPGTQFKMLMLKTPNPTRNNTIGFEDVLPTEFGLEKYVDKNTQFEKVFIKPLQGLTRPIGWTTEKKQSIESFGLFD